MKKNSVKEIVEAAGGYPWFFTRFGLSNFAVRSWFIRGIPRRYHPAISRKLGIKEQDILEANRRAVQSATKKAS
jgi:hypothetical protein